MQSPHGHTLNVTGSAFEQKMHTFDFDAVINRRGTGCLKYDSAVKRGYPEDVLPAWVADMDFPAAPVISEALRAKLEHGIFGYGQPPEDYYQAICNWWSTYHGYSLKSEYILDSPGVIFLFAPLSGPLPGRGTV